MLFVSKNWMPPLCFIWPKKNPLPADKVDKASDVIIQDIDSGSVFCFSSKEDAQAFINENKS